MKALLATLLLALSLNALAETKLSCWNIYDKKGSAPILTADIESDNVLTNVTFDFKNEYFAGYFFETQTTKSYLENSTLEQRPEEITTNRSPYKGNNAYVSEIGNYRYSSADYQSSIIYKARLILPKDLSNKNLKTFIMKEGTRSNAVVDLDPSKIVGQSGQEYLRMFCASK